MMQVFTEKSVAYCMSVGMSVVFGGSWLFYPVYLLGSTVTKQSVYMGAITAYAGLLLSVSGIALGVLLTAIARLIRTRNQLAQRAAVWGYAAMLVAVVVFIITRPIINAAT